MRRRLVRPTLGSRGRTREPIGQRIITSSLPSAWNSASDPPTRPEAGHRLRRSRRAAFERGPTAQPARSGRGALRLRTVELLEHQAGFSHRGSWMSRTPTRRWWVCPNAATQNARTAATSAASRRGVPIQLDRRLLCQRPGRPSCGQASDRLAGECPRRRHNVPDVRVGVPRLVAPARQLGH
jgi:hypothetical protein